MVTAQVGHNMGTQSTFLQCGSLFLPVSMYSPVEQHFTCFYHYITYRYRSAISFFVGEFEEEGDPGCIMVDFSKDQSTTPFPCISDPTGVIPSQCTCSPELGCFAQLQAGEKQLLPETSRSGSASGHSVNE